MKRCSICKIDKDVSEFNRNSSRKDGLQTKCRDCSRKESRQHYASSPGYYHAKNKFRREDLIQEIVRLKEGKPCQDCGGTFHHVAMDFDHRDATTKVGSIASLIRQSGWSLPKILEEVSKCDLVCANCHRVRTFTRTYQQGGANVKSEKRFW